MRNLIGGFALSILALPLWAQDDCEAQCQAGRNAQDPFAHITALIINNTIGFGSVSANISRQDICAQWRTCD